MSWVVSLSFLHTPTNASVLYTCISILYRMWRLLLCLILPVDVHITSSTVLMRTGSDWVCVYERMKYKNMTEWMYESMREWAYECKRVWENGLMDVWENGLMNVWENGLMDVWQYERMGSNTCRRLCVCEIRSEETIYCKNWSYVDRCQVRLQVLVVPGH